jgi:Flp pilus assembly protein TadG
MPTPHLVSVLKRNSARFAAHQRGTSAIEFALLSPVMLTMYFGALEVADALSADRQASLVASTVSNVTSQYAAVANTDVSTILTAGAAVITPYAASNLTVVLSSVLIDAGGNARVDWSASASGTPRSGTVTSLIPQNLLIPNSSVIWTETTYSYKPIIGYVVTGTLSLHNQAFSVPRLSASVTCTPSTLNCIFNQSTR